MGRCIEINWGIVNPMHEKMHLFEKMHLYEQIHLDEKMDLYEHIYKHLDKQTLKVLIHLNMTTTVANCKICFINKSLHLVLIRTVPAKIYISCWEVVLQSGQMLYGQMSLSSVIHGPTREPLKFGGLDGLKINLWVGGPISWK